MPNMHGVKREMKYSYGTFEIPKPEEERDQPLRRNYYKSWVYCTQLSTSKLSCVARPFFSGRLSIRDYKRPFRLRDSLAHPARWIGARAKGALINGLVCLALCTRVKLQESGKTNQIALFVITA